MTYVVSDFFGNEGLFERVKKEIEFSEDDYMFILGNMIDYGPDSVSLLVELTYAMNVWPVAGKHELIAREMLSGFESMLAEGGSPDADFIEKMKAWTADGGDETFSAFRELDPELKEGVLDYLNEMPTCETVKVRGKKYLLISEEATLNPEDIPEGFEGDDVIRVIGHPENASAGIVKEEKQIMLGSCGELGSSVSVLRLEDRKGFLVK